MLILSNAPLGAGSLPPNVVALLNPCTPSAHAEYSPDPYDIVVFLVLTLYFGYTRLLEAKYLSLKSFVQAKDAGRIPVFGGNSRTCLFLAEKTAKGIEDSRKS